MTDQEVFDKVAVHLLTQRKKSFCEGDGPRLVGCMYRNPEGLRCAVGVLIPDNRYNPNLEGVTADNPIVVDALEGICSNIGLLMELQCIHDSLPVVEWARELRRVAKFFGLNTKAIKGKR